jgi:hypothetical protein
MIIIYFKRLYIKIQNTITFDMQNLSKNKKKTIIQKEILVLQGKKIQQVNFY